VVLLVNAKAFAPKLLQLTLLVGSALAGAIIFIWAFGPAQYQIDGFRVAAAVRPAKTGQTVVELPPLGTLTARTHAFPVECRLTLLQVEERTVTAALQNPDLSLLWGKLRHDAGDALKSFVLRQFALGALGALFFTWPLLRLPLRRLWLPPLTGLLTAAALLGPVYLTYQPEAFKHPAYSGIIEAAPRILALSENLVSGFQELNARAPELIANLQELFQRADTLNNFSLQDGDTRLLLVSDIHNNPVALVLARELATRFAVSAILDAGDLTDLGLPLELNLVEGIGKLPVPYVLAPGNHDSPAVMDALAARPRVYVLHGQVVNIAGLKVLGAPDPSAYRPTPKASGAAQEEAELKALAEQLTATLKRSPTRVDVLVVHNPAVARRFRGQVPLIVCGHTHEPAVERDTASLLLNPGTTGAAGIRGLQSATEVPYTAMIVHLNPQKRPVAVDIITYGPRAGSFQVEHRLIPAPTPPRALPRQPQVSLWHR
jgi:Icc-related predicted phosphoesterase